MIIGSIIGLLLSFIVTAFHYFGLMQITVLLNKWKSKGFFRAPTISFLVSFLHVIEIFFFGLGFFLLDSLTDSNAFTGKEEITFQQYFYFSGVTYTTLGLSQINPSGLFKFLTVIESLNGFMMLTWSASFFFKNAAKFDLSENG